MSRKIHRLTPSAQSGNELSNRSTLTATHQLQQIEKMPDGFIAENSLVFLKQCGVISTYDALNTFDIILRVVPRFLKLKLKKLEPEKIIFSAEHLGISHDELVHVFYPSVGKHQQEEQMDPYFNQSTFDFEVLPPRALLGTKDSFKLEKWPRKPENDIPGLARWVELGGFHLFKLSFLYGKEKEEVEDFDFESSPPAKKRWL